MGIKHRREPENKIILYGNYNSKIIVIKDFIWTKDEILLIAEDHD